jgi:aldose 1-epimerase
MRLLQIIFPVPRRRAGRPPLQVKDSFMAARMDRQLCGKIAPPVCRRLTAALCGIVVFVAGSSRAAEPVAKIVDSKSTPEGKHTVRQQSFGKTADGTEELLFTCTNSNGCELKVTTYGARIVSLTVPDRNGKLGNVVLGFDTLEPYLTHKMFFGCATGRFANRVAKGQFDLDGKKHQLATNNGPNHLHGGLVGFDRKTWQAKPLETPTAVGVEFTYTSPDGEEGYPGKLRTTVTYLWSNDDVLSIVYTAKTDKTTVVNLTNHAYWNLAGVAAGKASGTILNEKLTIAADKYLPTDDTSIPLGEPADVQDTAMDFTTPHLIGERIDALKKSPSTTKGYDHCYVLRDWQPSKPGQPPSLYEAARVVDPSSGRIMEISTSEPGIQFYSGNFLEGDSASGGFNQHDALCLETQHYPDSPNKPAFPTTVLKPDETFQSITVHKFTAK